MNAKEIINTLNAAIEERDITISQFVEYDYSDEDSDFLIEKLGEFELIASNRVGSDMDQYQNVFKFGNVYIAIYGDYSSWDGADYNQAFITEVIPAQTTIYRPTK